MAHFLLLALAWFALLATVLSAGPATWMKDLSTANRDKSLRELAIPGTHDSGAYYLDTTSPYAPSASGLGDIKLFCLNIKSRVRDWSITQSVDITQQLADGIRYLDLRTAYKADENKFRIVHALYGVELTTVFDQVKTFSDVNPKEVIILDFNQFYDLTPALHVNFSDQIIAKFGASIATSSFNQNSSLNDLAASGHNIVVIYHDTATASSKGFWPSSEIDYIWPNTADSSAMVDSLNSRLDSFDPTVLNLYFAVLTPDFFSIAFNPFGSLKDTLIKCGNKKLKTWLNGVQANKGLNIVAVDFYELSSLPTEVLKLN